MANTSSFNTKRTSSTRRAQSRPLLRFWKKTDRGRCRGTLFGDAGRRHFAPRVPSLQSCEIESGETVIGSSQPTQQCQRWIPTILHTSGQRISRPAHRAIPL
jgi:hypothetical protein